MKNARQYLTELYLDFVNNYLTLVVFAEHHGLTFNEAEDLIALGRQVVGHAHPEA